MRRVGALDTALPHLVAFLRTAKDRRDLASNPLGESANARFIPRNFLLDERMDPERLPGYAGALGPRAVWSLPDWDAAHKHYLDQFVFVKPLAGDDLGSLRLDNPRTCPETFRSAPALATFQSTDRQTHLLRLVPVRDLAHLANADPAAVWTLAQAWVGQPDDSNPLREPLARVLDEAATGPRCDHRPVFAAFYEDLAADLHETDWADRMRDRLGLYHVSQMYPRGLPARVLLFRYPVEDLPRRRGERDTRLIAVPSVLDHGLSVAFCPAPRELTRGRVVDLRAGGHAEPVREVLHPFIPFEVRHLVDVGEVTRAVPEILDNARRDHLVWLQLLAGRDDYASETDGDLLK